MSPDEYQNLANDTAPESYPSLDYEVTTPSVRHIIHAQLGISSEAGEIADAIKKYLIYRQPMDFENVKEECGDLLWYIALLLSACGYRMEDCMKENIEKLRIRYPEKFSEQDALERKDKQQTSHE